MLTRRQVEFEKLVAGFLLHAAGRRHGTVALRGILEARDPGASEPPMSEIERLLRRVLDYPELPEFLFEVTPPWWPPGSVRVDAYSPDCRLIIEVDGRRWHTRERDFVNDRRRDNLAVANDHVVLRFTYDDLKPPFVHVRRTILRTAQTRGWLRPSGEQPSSAYAGRPRLPAYARDGGGGRRVRRSAGLT